METIKLTIGFIKKLQPGKAARYADSEVPGLQVRVSATKVSYYFRKRHNYKVYEFLVGHHPDIMLEEARTMALEKLAALSNYGDISSVVVRKQPTVKEAIDLWLESQSNKAKAKSAMRYFIRWEDKKIAELTAPDIERMFYSMKKTPVAANRSFRYLKTAFNKVFRKLKMENPVPYIFDGITKHPESPRTRYLQEEEAPVIIETLKQMRSKPMYTEQAKALLLMVYSGQRKSRVLGITVEQIERVQRPNGELHIWHVPGNRNKLPVDLTLNEYAWGIVTDQIKIHPRGHLFLWRGKPMKDCRKTLLAACREHNIENLHIHDLRRSLGTWMLSSGATIEEVSETLGHSSIRVTEQVYAHLLGSRGREATTTAIDAMLKGKV